MSQLVVHSERLPAGWRIEQLKNILQKTSSVDPRKTPEEEFEYIDVSSVSRATFSIEKTARIKGVDAPSRARRHVKAGDILFATIRPTLQRVAIVPDYLDGQICSTGYFVLRPKPEIDEQFLYYYLFTKPFMSEMEHRQKGASYPAVNDGDIREQIITYPSLPEQQRIVAILDEAFASIDQAVANAEKNLANARELFESYLNNVFTEKGEGWVEKRLSDICEGKITDGTHQTPKYFDDGYIFLSSKNVKSRSVDWDNIKYIDEVQHIDMQKRLSPQVNDILLAKNGTTGVAAIVDKEIKFDIYVSLALLRPSAKILPRYLLHFINSPVAKKQFDKRLKGVGVPNLHLNEIREVQVQYPELLEEQSRIIDKLDLYDIETQHLETIYQKKLTALAELKQSILQKAFNGELTAGTVQQQVNG